MTSTLASSPLAVAARVAGEGLEAAAPELVAPFRAALPRAVDVVSRRLLSACFREGLAATAGRYACERYAFDRVEVAEPVRTEPALLLAELTSEPAGGRVAAELTDAVVNLAVGYARRAGIDRRVRAAAAAGDDLTDVAGALDADAQARFFERLATEGHNLHPCGRTRIGWTVADVLAHDLETEATEVGFVGVRRGLHVGDDVGELLGVGSPLDPARYAVTPVHAWQLDAVLRTRYADLITDGAIVPLAARWTALPTAALRTVLVADRYLKLSLDIQVTSTRRSISVASTRNGPAISAVLADAVAGDPACARVLLLSEPAGSAMTGSRDVAAIVRDGLGGRLRPGEVAVPGSALPARSPLTGASVLTELVDRYARHRGIGRRAVAGLRFLDEYARLLLPPVLSLATGHGIGLEAHLQNCVPTFVDGVPHRIALRDLAGLRLHRPRLRAGLTLWPGSVIATDDPDVMRAKVGYTALQAHLGEVVIGLVRSHGVVEAAAWSVVRAVVDEEYDRMRGEPRLAAAARADHAFLTAPTMPHKALLRMRLAAGGDRYVPVRNPLR